MVSDTALQSDKLLEDQDQRGRESSTMRWAAQQKAAYRGDFVSERPNLLVDPTSTAVVIAETWMRMAAAAMERAQGALRGGFRDAVCVLSECQGTVILSGAGKSGIVAQKVAGTMASLGIRARAMHAYDGLHGDLGAVNREDVVLLFSHSGQTFEVIALLQGARERRSETILITGDTSSPAAALADVLIDTGVSSDEEYLGIVPTTSALIALAFGDALAVAVASLAGTAASDFRFNHPSNRRQAVALPHATQPPSLSGA